MFYFSFFILHFSFQKIFDFLNTPGRIRTDTYSGLKPLASANWATGAYIKYSVVPTSRNRNRSIVVSSFPKCLLSYLFGEKNKRGCNLTAPLLLHNATFLNLSLLSHKKQASLLCSHSLLLFQSSYEPLEKTNHKQSFL